MEVVKNFMTDTVGLVRYLEDNLPVPASDLFSQAEIGETSIQLPRIAMKGRLRLADPKNAVKRVIDELRVPFLYSSPIFRRMDGVFFRLTKSLNFTTD